MSWRLRNRIFRGGGFYPIVLVILLAIVIPSILLSMLGIWAIGAERSQLQEKIRREALAMTEKVVRATSAALESAQLEIAAQAANLKNPAGALIMLESLRSTHPYLSYLVIVHAQGAIVYPPVPCPESMIVLGPASPELSDALRKAHNFEFTQTDLEAAARVYEETYKSATEKRLKASALLGLARVEAKRGELEQAVQLYQTAANSCGGLREESGLLVGPAATLRIAIIASQQDAPEEFVKRLSAAHQEVENCRSLLTEEEADFFDVKLTSLAKDFLAEDTNNPAHEAALRRIIEKTTERRATEEILRRGVAELSSNRFFDKNSLMVYEHNGKSYLAAGAPFRLEGRRFAACAVAPVSQLESLLVASEVERLATREEVGIAVFREGAGVVAGEAPAPNSFRLSSSKFPAPLSKLTAASYLKGYESLAVLSSIRTNIYVWAVGLAITGIIAGAIVTYFSVSRAMRTAELKSDFISNVTHELKTPLTSIRMFAETLQDGRVRDKEDAKECLEAIVTESERLSRLIDKVLDFRVIEKGKRKFHFREADLRQVILETLRAFRRQMRGYEATIYVNVPHDLPPVKMDPDAIGQVLLNLLTNAYKYSQPHDRRIWVSAAASDGTSRISVEDRGVGIPRRELKTIFKKFYRVDDSLTRDVDGAGLGLTISKHVAEAHGGTIEVESKPGKGSKFTLVIKL